MRLTQEQKDLVKHTIKAKGYTITSFCKAAGFDIRQFYMWLHGGTGERNHTAEIYVEELKKRLDLTL